MAWFDYELLKMKKFENLSEKYTVHAGIRTHDHCIRVVHFYMRRMSYPFDSYGHWICHHSETVYGSLKYQSPHPIFNFCLLKFFTPQVYLVSWIQLILKTLKYDNKCWMTISLMWYDLFFLLILNIHACLWFRCQIVKFMPCVWLLNSYM